MNIFVNTYMRMYVNMYLPRFSSRNRTMRAGIEAHGLTHRACLHMCIRVRAQEYACKFAREACATCRERRRSLGLFLGNAARSCCRITSPITNGRPPYMSSPTMACPMCRRCTRICTRDARALARSEQTRTRENMCAPFFVRAPKHWRACETRRWCVCGTDHANSSLSLSVTHTHTHAHTHTYTLSLSLTHTHTHARARMATQSMPCRPKIISRQHITNSMSNRHITNASSRLSSKYHEHIESPTPHRKEPRDNRI